MLTLPDLANRLRAWMNDDANDLPQRFAILVGGGAAADVVRDWDRLFRLGDVASHELAIESLSLTARLLTQLLPGTALCRNRQELQALWNDGLLPVLVPAPFLADLESSTDERLPAHWEVTSDSMAAWIAIHTRFSRLVLVKSVPQPDSWTESDAVDPFFQQLAPHLPDIQWLNLRRASQEPAFT